MQNKKRNKTTRKNTFRFNKKFYLKKCLQKYKTKQNKHILLN